MAGRGGMRRHAAAPKNIRGPGMLGQHAAACGRIPCVPVSRTAATSIAWRGEARRSSSGSQQCVGFAGRCSLQTAYAGEGWDAGRSCTGAELNPDSELRKVNVSKSIKLGDFPAG